MFLHVSLNPPPQVGFELQMIYPLVWWEASNLHSEIPRCDLHLIQLLAYDVLVPLLKRDQKEHYENYY